VPTGVQVVHRRDLPSVGPAPSGTGCVAVGVWREARGATGGVHGEHGLGCEVAGVDQLRPRLQRAQQRRLGAPHRHQD
jgi:hypothetical protein